MFSGATKKIFFLSPTIIIGFVCGCKSIHDKKYTKLLTKQENHKLYNFYFFFPQGVWSPTCTFFHLKSLFMAY